jgi:diguanylate cyclase (GGDEF)-like protein/PAS domain S-box-containing protein
VEIVGTLHDVTSIVEATERFEASERRFRRLFDHNPSGTAVVDDDGVILEVNQALCDLLGRRPEELVGCAYDSLVHHEERADVRVRRHAMAGRVDAVGRAERRFVHSDGSVRHVRVLVTRVADAGRFVSIVSFDDVTAQLVAQRRLEHAALHDPLTGLPNRRLLLDRLEQALTRRQRTGTCIAVLFLDLDRVKQVNDSHGHEAGDHVIATVARRLSGCLREHDTVARHGGDEFVIVCQDVADESEVAALAERVLEAVGRPITWGRHRLTVTVSIGIAVTPASGAPADDLLRTADIAMYDAKTSGRARYAMAGAP